MRGRRGPPERVCERTRGQGAVGTTYPRRPLRPRDPADFVHEKNFEKATSLRLPLILTPKEPSHEKSDSDRF